MILVNPGSVLLPGFLRQGRSFCHKECPLWHISRRKTAGRQRAECREETVAEQGVSLCETFLFGIKNVFAKFDNRLG